jgi:suppressor of fused
MRDGSAPEGPGIRRAELGEISTPNGKVSFLLLTGVTAQENEQMVASSTAAVLNVLARSNPLLITDTSRVPNEADPHQ